MLLQRLLFQGPYGDLNGWYLHLTLGAPIYGDEAISTDNLVDYLVADYHTTPTDCFGSVMGWVKHVGTGALDMAIITAPAADGQPVAFVGPVMSYHEYTTTNFQRLTDVEWAAEYLATASRPDWVNLYLADNKGKIKESGASLVVTIDPGAGNQNPVPQTHLIAGNYPNPFNAGTIIYYTIPTALGSTPVELTVFNVQGKIVKPLVHEILPGGNYLTQWDGSDENGHSVSSGIYFYLLKAGPQQISGKMVMVK
jgi:hypothetical protein